MELIIYVKEIIFKTKHFFNCSNIDQPYFREIKPWKSKNEQVSYLCFY